MTKKKESEFKDADEFHKLNTKEAQGHLHYVCGKKGKRYESVGLTHSKKTRGKVNLPLKKIRTRKTKGRPMSARR